MSKEFSQAIEEELRKKKERPVDEAGVSEVYEHGVVRDISFVSMPLLSQTAFAIARQWRTIPDTVSDDDALAQGLISPEFIELIMVIIQTIMQDCLDNQPSRGWGRIRAYLDSRERDRMGDNTRLNWLIDRWVVRLGVARDRGDVVEIRRAMVTTVNGMNENQFRALQTEILFLTI